MYYIKVCFGLITISKLSACDTASQNLIVVLGFYLVSEISSVSELFALYVVLDSNPDQI